MGHGKSVANVRSPLPNRRATFGDDLGGDVVEQLLLELEQALGKPSDISKLGPVEQWTYKASNGTVVFLIVADKVTLQATGGETPYTWSFVSGDWPEGLTLDEDSGVIEGYPTTAGDYTFTIRVSDNSTPAKDREKDFDITISAS